MGRLIFRSTPLEQQRLWPERLSRFLFTDPFFFALKKNPAVRIRNERRKRQHDISVPPERDAQPAGPLALAHYADGSLTEIDRLFHMSAVHLRTDRYLARFDIGNRRGLDILDDIRAGRKRHPSHRCTQHDDQKQSEP